MPRFPGYFSFLVLFLLLALSLAFAADEAGEGFVVDERSPSAPAPGFTLPDLEGGEVSLSDFQGRVVVVHFWASWCEPCRREFPALERLAGRFEEQGLVVLAVAADSRERTERFVSDLGVDTSKVRVLVDRYGSAMRSYGVRVLPVSVMVDRVGRVAGAAVGERDYGSDGAREYFEELLAKDGRQAAGSGVPAGKIRSIFSRKPSN